MLKIEIMLIVGIVIKNLNILIVVMCVILFVIVVVFLL